MMLEIFYKDQSAPINVNSLLFKWLQGRWKINFQVIAMAYERNGFKQK